MDSPNKPYTPEPQVNAEFEQQEVRIDSWKVEPADFPLMTILRV